MTISDFIADISNFTRRKIPFLFLVDFEKKKPVVVPLEKAREAGFLFDIKGKTNILEPVDLSALHPELEIFPVDRDRYSKAFQRVIENIRFGNSYLLNLTFPSEVKTCLNLEQIFHMARALYKLLYKDHCLIYSPESFIQIKDDFIYTYPMKGTIDAAVPNAAETLMQNSKELWEHNTIVDLLRNDLSMVATDVQVTRFRYLEKIKTHKNEIFQTSSEIRGKLPDDWQESLGELIIKLLPAGSISGAPKEKTVQIIQDSEMDSRGYYTGIFGIYDGNSVDSAVCIRYIEKKDNRLWYRSGGGITFMSDMEEEYEELVEKIYVPTC